MRGKTITAVAEIDLEDSSPFDEGLRRLKEEFEPQLKIAARRTDFPAEVLGVEAMLRSPHGTSPVKFTVELMLRGSSWSSLREAANKVVSEAARASRIGIIEAEGLAGDENRYEQQGTQLVPA